jgi:hypothetical protein
MATKKQTTKKINFNKFFPDADSYVTLTGVFDPKASKYDMLDLNLTIQNGTRSAVNFFTWFGDNNVTLKQLKAIQEATTKAIKFLEEAEAAQKEAKKKEPIKVEPRVTKQRK